MRLHNREPLRETEKETVRIERERNYTCYERKIKGYHYGIAFKWSQDKLLLSFQHLHLL